MRANQRRAAVEAGAAAVGVRRLPSVWLSSARQRATRHRIAYSFDTLAPHGWIMAQAAARVETVRAGAQPC
jgi:hypothetical protein